MGERGRYAEAVRHVEHFPWCWFCASSSIRSLAAFEVGLQGPLAFFESNALDTNVRVSGR